MVSPKCWRESGRRQSIPDSPAVRRLGVVCAVGAARKAIVANARLFTAASLLLQRNVAGSRRRTGSRLVAAMLLRIHRCESVTLNALAFAFEVTKIGLCCSAANGAESHADG